MSRKENFKYWILKNHILSLLTFLFVGPLFIFIIHLFDISEEVLDWFIILGGVMIVFAPIILVYEKEKDILEKNYKNKLLDDYNKQREEERQRIFKLK